MIPTPEKEEKQREEEGKKLDNVTDYYTPSPLYPPTYEEDAPTLVNNLVPEATPEEKTNKDKMGGGRGDSGNNTHEDIGGDVDDSDSDYIY